MAKTKTQEIKYKVISNKEGTFIEKTGMVEKFSLEDLQDVIKYNEKLKTECESNLSIREAEKQNIIDFYPKVLDMTEEEIFRIAMFHKKEQEIAEYKEKLSEIYKKLTEQNNILKIVLLKQKVK